MSVPTENCALSLLLAIAENWHRLIQGRPLINLADVLKKVGVRPGAWQNWRRRIAFPQAGYCEVWSRANDSAGDVQPFAIDWNPRGYLNNSVHRIARRVPRELPIIRRMGQGQTDSRRPDSQASRRQRLMAWVRRSMAKAMSSDVVKRPMPRRMDEAACSGVRPMARNT